MTNLDIGKKNFNIDQLREGLKIDRNNKFLKQYDLDGNSIFSANELAALKKDLETAAGNDKKLQREEAVKLLAEKMNISLEEAQKLYGTGEVISDGLTGLTAQQEAQEITETLNDLIEDNFTFASADKKKFQNVFNKINEDNILEVLEEYKKRSGGETLSAAIMAEKTASGGGRAGAIKKNL